MALSLKFLLANRRVKKNTSRNLIYNNTQANTNHNIQSHSILNTLDQTHQTLNSTSSPTYSTYRRYRHKRKHKNNVLLDHKSVINLYQTPLSRAALSVLSRGLTFCPTPSKIN